MTLSTNQASRPMVTIIIPTRNRAYVLGRTLPSYFEQRGVDEIIIVDDGSDDDTASVARGVARRYPDTDLITLRNDRRRGLPYSRARGVGASHNPLYVFGEDDAFLAPNYVNALRQKLTEDVAIVSGRIIYLQPNQTPDEALAAFGTGDYRANLYSMLTLRFRPHVRFSGDLYLPFTHALFLARKDVVGPDAFDTAYGRGNCLREETVAQLAVRQQGWKILATNDTHCFHLSADDVRQGGCRVSPISMFYWNVLNTRRMFDDHFDLLRDDLMLPYEKGSATAVYALFQAYLLGKRFVQTFGRRQMV